MPEEKKELTEADKGAHGTCETCQIADANAPGGFVEINKSDFDEKAHKLFVAKAEKSEAEADKSKAKK